VKTPLRLLLLEDDPIDADLIAGTLAEAGLDCTAKRVDTRSDFLAELETGNHDLILADYSIPGFDGMTALTLARQQAPEIPFLFVSATIGEELAIDANESDRRRLQQDPPAPAASEPVEPNGSRPYPRLALASSPEHLNFNYEIVGTAAFRPISVFDDGATTFIQFRPGIGDIPAVFRVVSGEGELELVEYAFKGQSLAIRRVLEAGLLKLGREEVRFYNRARGSRAAPSFFGEEGKR